ncbi:chromosome segregation protein SMC, partial [Escherichia coli]|nr:chromosome segregation protein SMC [Escherichia coli]
EDDGLRRKEELDKYIEGNEFITVHYAENTFETELVRYDENNNLFIEVMKTEYKKEAYFKKAESDINSSDLRVRYKRVLKFAKKIGKGWLATEMVEHLSVDNRVPDYILQAIQFVLRDRNVEPIYQKMLDYNMSLMGVKAFDCINAEKDFSSKMIEYKKHFNDSFVRLLEL